MTSNVMVPFLSLESENKTELSLINGLQIVKTVVWFSLIYVFCYKLLRTKLWVVFPSWPFFCSPFEMLQIISCFPPSRTQLNTILRVLSSTLDMEQNDNFFGSRYCLWKKDWHLFLEVIPHYELLKHWYKKWPRSFAPALPSGPIWSMPLQGGIV